MQVTKNKEESINENRQSIESEYLNYSYRPHTNYSSHLKNSFRHNKKSVSNLKFYDRLDSFQHKKTQNMNKLRNLVDSTENAFTFVPRTNEKILTCKDNFTERYHQQVVDYAKKLNKFRANKSPKPQKKPYSGKHLNSYVSRSQSRNVAVNSPLTSKRSVQDLRETWRTQGYFSQHTNLEPYYYHENAGDVDAEKLMIAIQRITKKNIM